MKFKITYKVFTIPSDEDTKIIHSFTYIASVNQLTDLSYSVNEYLQMFFYVGNYEITCIEKAES